MARLQAELGNVEKAITLIEALKETARLTTEDQSALADWYLVTDRREEFEQSKIAALDVTQEYILSNFINQRSSRWQNLSLTMPTELDENVLFAFKALFRKSSYPEQYLSSLVSFYKASRDFRMLQMVPDALIGQTPQRVYPMLRGLSSDLLNLVQKEATADELMQRIEELRRNEKLGSTTESATLDARALNLLEAMIAHRTAMVLNQPGPHIDRATTALKNAFKGEWAKGEIQQMAEFLAAFKTPKMEVLTLERLRQLRVLRDLCELGTDDHFYVSWQAGIVTAQLEKPDQAIAIVESAVYEVLPFHPDGVPVGLNGGMFKFVDMLNQRGRFAKAESFLNERIENSLNESQRIAYSLKLNKTLIEAHRRSGTVSLGSGRELYTNLQRVLLEQLEKAQTDSHRSSVLRDIVSFYHAKTQPETGDDVWAFAMKKFPKTLKGQPAHQLESVGHVVELVKRINGEVKALEFLIERFENFPEHFQIEQQNPWQRFGYQIAGLRESNKKEIRKLEPRLLAIVLDALRTDLRTKNSISDSIYRRGHRFWEEKEYAFMQVAEEVVAEFPNDSRVLVYVARYMADGLSHRKRAIKILSAAHENGLLKWNHLNDLVEYLHEDNQYGKAIPILESLVKDRPDDMRHRTDLLLSYYGTKQKAKGEQLLADTDSHFRSDGRWTETTVTALGRGCLEVGHYEEAVGYINEAIAMRKRSPEQQRYHGGGYDANVYMLSQYYDSLAGAWSKLGNTRKAVDSKMAAIVIWGNNQDYRRNYVNGLTNILKRAKDLDQFVASIDKESENTGQDSPLLRKYLGFTYADKGKYKKAIPQLRLAIEMQPTDVETHTKLIEVLDKTKDKAGAIRQTLALIDFDRHNLNHYKKLAERLKEDEAMSERAITTIVEAAPGEAEHHQAIAEIRQTQDRWQDAIAHWKQVAELRRLEPTGLLNLAEAQIQVGENTAAEETLRKLDTELWPARFDDVDSEVKRMRKLLLKK